MFGRASFKGLDFRSGLVSASFPGQAILGHHLGLSETGVLQAQKKEETHIHIHKLLMPSCVRAHVCECV
jgi:hypothetical protein